MKELPAIINHVSAAGSTPGVLATLVSVEGSSYRRPGARLLATPDGKRIGSISGGCLEEDVLVRARAVAATGKAELITYDTTTENDLVWGVGLGCSGVVQVLLEKLPPQPAWAAAMASGLAARRPTAVATVWKAQDPALLGTHLSSELPALLPDAGVFRQDIRPPVSLVVFGAGDDARPLVRIAKEIGWCVTVADPRSAFATGKRFPEADACASGPADKLVAQVAPERDSLAVVMTHHYVHDVPLLRDLLQLPLTYIGLLGPQKRAEKIVSDLAAAGFAITPEMRARLHAPVGLDLGADGPEEVALAIMAEIQAVLGKRNARPLRERKTAIHA